MKMMVIAIAKERRTLMEQCEGLKVTKGFMHPQVCIFTFTRLTDNCWFIVRFKTKVGFLSQNLKASLLALIGFSFEARFLYIWSVLSTKWPWRDYGKMAMVVMVLKGYLRSLYELCSYDLDVVDDFMYFELILFYLETYVQKLIPIQHPSRVLKAAKVFN